MCDTFQRSYAKLFLLKELVSSESYCLCVGSDNSADVRFSWDTDPTKWSVKTREEQKCSQRAIAEMPIVSGHSQSLNTMEAMDERLRFYRFQTYAIGFLALLKKYLNSVFYLFSQLL